MLRRFAQSFAIISSVIITFTSPIGLPTEPIGSSSVCAETRGTMLFIIANLAETGTQAKTRRLSACVIETGTSKNCKILYSGRTVETLE